MFFHTLEKLHEYYKQQPIAIAFGCFDLLHRGHVKFFENINKSTDLPIIIGILDDETVRYMKGASRPIRNERERAEIVDAIRYIDGTFIPCEKGNFSEYQARYGLTEKDRELWSKCLYSLDIIRPKEFYYSTDFAITPEILQFFEDCDIMARTLPYTEGVSTTLTAQKLISENH